MRKLAHGVIMIDRSDDLAALVVRRDRIGNVD